MRGVCHPFTAATQPDRFNPVSDKINRGPADKNRGYRCLRWNAGHRHQMLYSRFGCRIDDPPSGLGLKPYMRTGFRCQNTGPRTECRGPWNQKIALISVPAHASKRPSFAMAIAGSQVTLKGPGIRQQFMLSP